MTAGLRLRVLVIEDDHGVREFYGRVLQSPVLGAEVVLAMDGQEGIDHIEADPPFDLVISDLSMPRKSGLDVLDHVMRRGLDLPVVLVSGSWSAENLCEAKQKGALEIIEKPIRVDVLRDLCRRMAERRLTH